MIKRVWYSVAMPKPPPLATYVTYEAFTGTPCTLDELKSYLSRFRRTEVLFACALLNTFLEHGVAPFEETYTTAW